MSERSLAERWYPKLARQQPPDPWLRRRDELIAAMNPGGPAQILIVPAEPGAAGASNRSIAARMYPHMRSAR
jgi:hypothetical protein